MGLHDLPAALPVVTMDMISAEGFNLPEMEKFNVELKKDSHGLGITIAGYVCEKGKCVEPRIRLYGTRMNNIFIFVFTEELSGIFIKSISEGSAADLCKKINVNDRIVEVSRIFLSTCKYRFRSDPRCALRLTENHYKD